MLRLTFCIAICLDIRAVGAPLQRTQGNNLIERNLLAVIRAQVSGCGSLDVGSLRPDALMLAVQEVGLFFKLLDDQGARRRCDPRRELQHTLSILFHVEASWWNRDPSQRRGGTLRDIAIERQAEQELVRREACLRPLAEGRLRAGLWLARCSAEVPKRGIRTWSR